MSVNQGMSGHEAWLMIVPCVQYMVSDLR